MYYTYVLKSEKSGKYYIGFTKDIDKRLLLHNSGKVSSTKKYRPWTLFLKEEYVDSGDARRREIQLKSWKKRSAIERLKFK